MPPSLADRPEGCHFRPRCPHAFDKCTQDPQLEARAQEASGARSTAAGCGRGRKRELRLVDGQIGLDGAATGAPAT